ncbi:MAG: outer membrane lipoprotein LolB [Methylobacterium sp.]|nr:outer membrane lipoprotein LolB [Methylobacterium sp.]
MGRRATRGSAAGVARGPPARCRQRCPARDAGATETRAVRRTALLAGLALLQGLLLAGCASAPPGPEPAQPGEQASGQAAWSGRLGWQVAAAPGREAQQASAAFELRGNVHQGSLELSSPLGTVLARAHWRPGAAELRTPEGSSSFEDLPALTRAAFGGEEVPLQALFDWLQGKPSPMAGHEGRAGGGFEPLGWGVDVSGLARGLLTARRPAEPAVTLRIRLEAAP